MWRHLLALAAVIASVLVTAGVGSAYVATGDWGPGGICYPPIITDEWGRTICGPPLYTDHCGGVC